MVIDDLDIVGVIRPPVEADTPLLVDPDAELSGSVALEFLMPVRRRHPQVFQNGGGVKHPELPQGDALDVSARPLDGLTTEEAG